MPFTIKQGMHHRVYKTLFSPPLKFFVNVPSFLRCFQGMDHEDNGVTAIGACIECIINCNLNVQKYQVTIMMMKVTPFGLAIIVDWKVRPEHLLLALALLGMVIPALLSALLSTGKAANWGTKWITEYVGADKLGDHLPQESLHTNHKCDKIILWTIPIAALSTRSASLCNNVVQNYTYSVKS